MAERLHLDAQNPWPGLAAFGEDDRDYFRGREREADELARLVRRERLTVLFGRSGLGKSSLLNAGLFPRLRDDLHLPVYLRIGYAARETPRQQVWNALAAACAAAGVQAPPPAADESLWMYFHRAGAGFWNLRRRPLLPVLVFDQFEEIFTLSDDDAAAARAAAGAFIDELADLVEDRPSEALRRELDADPARGELIDFERRGCRVVLSFREDFLAEVEGLRTRMPSLMRNRFRLLPMSGEQARAVIAGGGALVGGDVAERIIGLAWRNRAEAPRPEEADRIEVDPALLSVICSELNLRRRAAGAATIEAGLLAGAEREILADFYERSLAGLNPAVREFVEDELITAAGYRDAFAYDDALARPGVSSEALEKLVAGRLLRLDERFGARRLELTHDVLTRVVMISRDRRKQARAEAERQRLEQLRTRRVRRLVAIGITASLTAFGVAIVFWVLLQQANAERLQLARTQSDVLLARANNLFELGVPGEPQISLARAIELNPQSQSAVGRAMSYLTQRSFPQRLAEQRLAQDAADGLVDIDWEGAGALALRTADMRRVVEVPAAAVAGAAAVPPLPARLSSGETRQHWPPEALPITVGPGLVAWLEGAGQLRSAAPDARGAAPGVRVDRPLPPVVLSVDGARAMLRAAGDRVLVYAVAPGRAPALLHNIAATHGSVRFGDGGRSVVARDGAVVTTYALDSDRLHQLVHPMPVNALEISPDGGQVATACQDQYARLWDTATGRPIGAPMRHEGSVLSVAFSPDGRRLLSGALDGTARLWSVADAEAASEPLLAGADVRLARFSPDGRHAVVLAAEGQLSFWRLDGPGSGRARVALSSDVTASALHAGPDLVAAAGADGSLGMWQLQQGAGAAAPLRPLWSKPPGGVVRRLAFDPSGARLAVATSEHVVLLVDAASGAPIGQPMPHRAAVLALRFSGDGSLLATGAADGGARLFDTRTQQLRGFPMMHGNEAVTRLELSPDQRLLLSASSRQEGFTVRVWPLSTREPQTLTEAGHLAFAGFRSDGEIVTAQDKSVQRWTVATGRDGTGLRLSPAAPALNLSHLIWSAALSRQRDLLAVGGLNGVTRTIDLAAGAAVGEPMKSIGVVEDVAFSSDGRWLLTRTAGLGARLWDSRSGYGVADTLGTRSGLVAAYLDGRASTAVLVTTDGGLAAQAVGLDFDFAGPPPRWLPALVTLAGGGRQDASGAMTWTPDRAAQLALLAADGEAAAPWWQQRRQEILARMGVAQAAVKGVAK